MTSEIARAIAKLQAFRKCGKPEESERWFRELARLLGYRHLLKD